MGIHSECFCGIEPLVCGSMLDFLVRTFRIALFLFTGFGFVLDAHKDLVGAHQRWLC